MIDKRQISETECITICHRATESLRIGVVYACSIDSSVVPEELTEKLGTMIRTRSAGLSSVEDAWRVRVRNLFRNGRYKPTGRGKPASEYLIRAAGSDNFPFINAPVDICNYISLMSLLPVSIWDVDRAEASQFVVRTGTESESYVFNSVGQEIGLHDLIVGCATHSCDDPGIPVVNPVKDSMKTKTTEDSNRIAAIVYGATEDGPTGLLTDICSEFARLLGGCGPSARASFGIARIGEEIRL